VIRALGGSMTFVTDNFALILYITGGMTLAGWLALLAPDLVWSQVMGRGSRDDAERMAVRVLGTVIGMDGVLLIWAGSVEEYRLPVLSFAIVSKGLFALMAFTNMRRIDTKPLVTLAVADSVMVILYVLYLLGF